MGRVHVLTSYLIDTHVLLWALGEDKRLPKRFSAILASDADVSVSIASLWEIAIKVSIGKLRVPEHVTSGLLPAGYNILQIRSADVAAVGRLPLHHRDPFDRMLIAQAQVKEMTVLTTDRHFSAYDITLA